MIDIQTVVGLVGNRSSRESRKEQEPDAGMFQNKKMKENLTDMFASGLISFRMQAYLLLRLQ